MNEFKSVDLEDLYIPPSNSDGEDNGQITIIGGSDLFHGAPILALKASHKIVDMVFFSSPEEYMQEVSAFIKSEVSGFIWVPFDEIDKYIDKSNAVLIGPGFKRYSSEGEVRKDEAYRKTREITQNLLKNHKGKKWVIDSGSLQTMDVDWIPEGSILTPNKKEYKILFDELPIAEVAKKYKCTVVLKGPETTVASPDQVAVVKGGNAGLTKGGTGDALAGLTTALLAKNEAHLAACAASYVVKVAAEELAEDVGTFFSADDLVSQIPYTFHKLSK